MICTIFPNGTDLRTVVDPGKNVFSWMISVLHKADTNTNIFPSIHVFNSLVVHITICKSDELGRLRLVKIASLVLCVSICLSTMVLKQLRCGCDGSSTVAYGYIHWLMVLFLLHREEKSKPGATHKILRTDIKTRTDPASMAVCSGFLLYPIFSFIPYIDPSNPTLLKNLPKASLPSFVHL